MKSYIQEIEDWRKAADKSLRRENGWLSLAGLFWLDEGENRFGTDPSNEVVFPPGTGPDRMGVLVLQDNQVMLRVEEDVDLSVDGEPLKETILKPDISGDPTEVAWEEQTFILIEREDGLGIRLWDNQLPARTQFDGRIWFPIDTDYLLEGVFEPFDQALDLVMSRKNGSDFQDQAQGQIIFQLGGRELALLAFEQEDGSFFTLFTDQTSGRETYQAGRYLVVPPPDEGSLVIDFNRAYNPPCAFTDFATCPLPPIQNRFDLPIKAGEKIVA